MTEHEKTSSTPTISSSKKRRMRRSRAAADQHKVSIQKPPTAKTVEQVNNSSVSGTTNRKKRKSKKQREKLAAAQNRSVSSTPNEKQTTKRPSTGTSKFESRKRPKFSYDDVDSRLKAARFRQLNELFYTKTSAEMVQYMHEHRPDFFAYHSGYQHQAALWPVRPVDFVINWIRKLPEHHVIADFGCGEAHIARAFPKRKVHSFDLVSVFRNNLSASNSETESPGSLSKESLANLVTECDMRNVPLPNSSVDIAVFCLSLMNTNLAEFICEAHRVLRIGGLLKIVEIRSRFDKVGKFAHKIRKFGFEAVSTESQSMESGRSLKNLEGEKAAGGNASAESDMFVMFVFRKSEEMRELHKQVTNARRTNSDVLATVRWPAEVSLRACFYKKR